MKVTAKNAQFYGLVLDTYGLVLLSL